MHHLLNAVTEREGFPAAVLIRAAEPLEGVDRMARARGTDQVHLLASGPGKLCQALGLDLRQNQASLRGPALWIEPGEGVPDRAVARSARIGCETAKPPWDKMPWRMFLRGSPFVTPGRVPRAQTRSGKAARHRE
jgi:DNA-3-methyladenine glycosylase